MKKTSLILIMLLLVTGLFSGCGSSDQIQVTTAKAKGPGDVSELSWNSTVQGLSTVEVVPAASGKVVSIPVQQGDYVQPGSVLFTIDSTDYALQVRQAEAGLSAANVALSSASASSSQNTSVGPAQVAYDDAVTNYNRVKALFDAGGISQVEFESARSKMETAASQLSSAKINQTGSYSSASAQVSSAKASLDIARKKLNDCTVTSPIAGKVAKIDTETGSFVSAQSPVVTVIDDSALEVKIQVAETDVEQLAVGSKMAVQVQAAGQSVNGTVSEIASVCDPKTGMFEVTVMLESAGDITAGMTATVTVAGDSASKSIYVPAKSITTDKDGKSSVYVVSDGHAKKQTVALGKKKNAYQEITKGLKTGDEVIVQSSGSLEDGMAIRVITAEAAV